MIKFKKTVLATIAGLGLLAGLAHAPISSAEAAAQPGEYNLLGMGNSSCGSWTAWRRAGQSLLDTRLTQQWILGFLSGIGYEGVSVGGNPLNGVDANAVWAWMDNYCQANPLTIIAKAGSVFATTHPH